VKLTPFTAFEVPFRVTKLTSKFSTFSRLISL
jgi:hypothetical protein